jgi:hypothetical protein
VKNKRPASIYLLIGALLFQGISGTIGGVALVMDPSGATLRIPTSWLAGSPFEDYSVPGLILLLVLGVFPLFVPYGIRTRARWAWFGSFCVGAALIVWIVMEILIIGYHARPPLQLIYGSLGMTILVLPLMPSSRGHFRRDSPAT